MIISVASELDAIAEPQPNVLNFASSMRPSLTLICETHDVAARGRADEARADVVAFVLGEGADVAGVLVVVE